MIDTMQVAEELYPQPRGQKGFAEISIILQAWPLRPRHAARHFLILGLPVVPHCDRFPWLWDVYFGTGGYANQFH